MSLPALILRNFWLKFFSVALALVIWLGIHYGIRNEFSISHADINSLLAQEYVRVPVAVVARPGDNRVFKVTPAEVVVIAVGEKTALRNEAKKGLRVYVDLTGFSSGPAVEEVRTEVAPDISVLDTIPPTVTVEQASP